jgi:hypothetical protein
MSQNQEWDLGSIQEIFLKIDNQRYVLVEASEEANRLYRNDLMKRTKMAPNSGKPIEFNDIADLDSQLLARCLFSLSENNERKPVQVQDVRKLSTRHTQALLKKLREMSEMDLEDTEAGLDEQIKQLQERKAALKGQTDEAKNEQSEAATS